MFNETFLLGTSSVCAEICIGGRVTGCLTLKKRELARLVLEVKEFLFRRGGTEKLILMGVLFRLLLAITFATNSFN
jgi:hypothetical protein